MHSNIETTLDRILAEAVEHEFVPDLEPLRVRVVGTGTRSAPTEGAGVLNVDPTHENCKDSHHSVGDEIS